MEARAEFLISYAEAHGPVTVRQLYYRAEVEGLPGIDKTESGYCKIQSQVLELRRAGRLDYDHIADATRWMRKPKSHASVQDAIEATARLYRKNLWYDADSRVEVWCEKDALAGVIYPITSKYDAPLMVTRGFTSETFAYESVEQWDDDKPVCVYYLGDFDRSGRDAANGSVLHKQYVGNKASHWLADNKGRCLSVPTEEGRQVERSPLVDRPNYARLPGYEDHYPSYRGREGRR